MPQSSYDSSLKSFLEQIAQTGIDLPKAAAGYLTQMKTPIRIFIVEGPGYGDIVFPLQLIRRLRQMGYQGIIEIIGSNLSKERIHFVAKVEPNLKSLEKMDQLLGALPLRKMAQLLGVEIEENQAVKKSVFTPDTLEVLLLDWHSFKNSNPPQVELAIFSGTSHYVSSSYKVLGDYQGAGANRLAKAQRSLLLNPFTELTTGFLMGMDFGLATQILGQAYRSDFPAKLLPYRVLPPSWEMIEFELEHIKNKSLKMLLENLFTHPDINNQFAIYGLNTLLHRSPQDYLFNFITAATVVNQQQSTKPLIVWALSSMEDLHWQKLQYYFNATHLNTTLQFFDMTKTMIHVPQPGMTNTTYVMRMPILQFSIFNQLIMDSTFPPIYEGANLGSFLRSLGKQGLYCQGRGFQEPDIPQLIKKANICANPDASSPKKIIPLLTRYMNETRAPFRGPDRLEYGLTHLSQQPDCYSPNPDCAFFYDSQQSLIPHRLLKLQEMSLTGAAMGSAQVLWQRFFQHVFGMSPKHARGFAGFIMTGGLLMLEKEMTVIDLYNIIFLILFETSTSLAESHTAQLGHAVLMMAILFNNLYNEMPDSSLETFLVVACCLVTAVASYLAAHKMTEKVLDILCPPPELSTSSVRKKM